MWQLTLSISAFGWLLVCLSFVLLFWSLKYLFLSYDVNPLVSRDFKGIFPNFSGDVDQAVFSVAVNRNLFES